MAEQQLSPWRFPPLMLWQGEPTQRWFSAAPDLYTGN
jgi:hypothetical protein